MTSDRVRTALALGTVACLAGSGQALAQLTVPTLPPVQTVVPSVLASPLVVVPTAAPALPAPTAVPTLPLPTAVPTPAVPTALPLPTAVPSLPVELPIAVPTAIPQLPLPLPLPNLTLVPTALPTALPDLPAVPNLPALPGRLPTVPVTLPSVPIAVPTALPGLPSLPGLPGLPVGLPLPAMPGLDGTAGIPAGAVRVPTVAGVSEVYLDLNGDGLADAKVSKDGTVKRVTPQQAAAVDRSTDGAGTTAARALAAKAGGVAGRAGRVVEGARTASSTGRSPAVLLFASLLTLAVAGSHVRMAVRSR